MHLNTYELQYLVKERLNRDRQFAARQAMVKEALADRPALRLRLGALFIRLGTWLQGGVEKPDVEAERANA